jgi:hypothetical protein
MRSIGARRADPVRALDPREAAGVIGRLLARPWIALVAALIIHTALWLAAQRDLAAADPLWYATWADKLAFHPAELFAAHNTYPFVMRLGLTGPIALAYRLFGVSTLATNLPCLLAGLAIVAIAYAAAPTPRGKLLAVLFAATCTPLIADAHELNPDLPCAAAMAASILCLARRDRPRGAGWVIGAAALWFAAFQIKEVAVWCAPAWIYAVIRDLRDHGGRRVARTFAPAAACGAVLATGYLAFCAVLWGDPLARLHGIDDAAHTHEWALDGEPAGDLAARLTWQPAALLYGMFRLALVPAVLSPWLVRGKGRIWVVATAGILVLYWFGSSTLATYLPLPIFRRMVLPVLPGLVIVAALATDAAIDVVRRRGPGARRRVDLVPWLGLVCALVLVVPHVRSVHRQIAALEHPERAAYQALRAEVASTSDRIVLVCGDFRCPPLTAFYFGFEPPPHLTVVQPPEFAAAPLPDHARVRLLVQVNRSHGAGRDVAQRADALGLARIVGHGDLRLYDAGDGTRLHDALTRR